MNNRRNFIRNTLSGSAAIGISSSVPNLLLHAAERSSNDNDDNILVVVQLSGGNDGLNTVIPYSDDEYYKNRFTLAVPRDDVIRIDDSIGFHPALREFGKLIEHNRLTVVQGVGYPNPNRSHFQSMDLWHTAHFESQAQRMGWLGRSIESELRSLDLPAVHLGEGVQPLALRTQSKPIASIRSLEDFQLNLLKSKRTRESIQTLLSHQRDGENSLLSYIHESADVALQTSHHLSAFDENSKDEYDYPNTRLGRNLSVTAKLIDSGLSTRIYYTTLEGFDTHSNQGPSHQGLLNEFSNSISAFMKQLQVQGNDKRVLVFAFSEFGRRVRENASRGTDHGTAAPVFLFGGALGSTIFGNHPSLVDLDEGDLKHLVDYRCVYADLLKNWLDIEPKRILGDTFELIGLFS